MNFFYICEVQKQFAIELLSMFLPNDLLNHFEVKTINELGDCKTKKMFYEMVLQEKNQLPSLYDQSDYESKGFYKEKRIQDFPIRGKALYLCIKRRRWRLKEDPSIVIKSDYRFIAEGTKLTSELSDFLKGTGRDPRRYDK